MSPATVRYPQQSPSGVQAVRTASHEFDLGLLKAVQFTPPPPMPAAERQRLESELSCLERELAATQRGINHFNDLLAA
jgi:hypothetical protein